MELRRFLQQLQLHDRLVELALLVTTMVSVVKCEGKTWEKQKWLWGQWLAKIVLLNLIPPMITPVYCVMGKYGKELWIIICAIAVQTVLLVPSTSAGFHTISLVPFVFLGESIAQPLQHLDSEFIPNTRQSNGSNSGTTTCAEPEAFAARTQPFTQRKLKKVRVALTASLLGLWCLATRGSKTACGPA